MHYCRNSDTTFACPFNLITSWNTELQVRTDDGVSLGFLTLNGSLTAYGAVFALSIIDNVLSVTVSRS